MKRPKYSRGHAVETGTRPIVANPDGSREERRAAKKLARGTVLPAEMFDRLTGDETPDPPEALLRAARRQRVFPPADEEAS